MRDALEHPGAWGLESAAPATDPRAVAVGALVIGIGLTEVLVLVGAAFAVGARRQSHALGLLVSSGGTPADVRRTVLAAGLWVGAAGSLLGGTLGAEARSGGGLTFTLILPVTHSLPSGDRPAMA